MTIGSKTSRTEVCVALAVAVVVAAGAQTVGLTQGQARALTIENIFGGQPADGVRQVSIAPDGKLVAITGEGPSGSGV